MNFSSFMTLCSIMTSFLIVTIIFVSYNETKMIEKKTQFECGFNEMSMNKSSFSTKFFLIMILFLVFDLEIAILLPSCTMQENMKMSIMAPSIFIVLLTLAMLMEWFNGMIEWST